MTQGDVEYFLGTVKIAACWVVNKLALMLQWIYIAFGTTAMAALIFPPVEDTIFKFLFLNAVLIFTFVLLMYIEKATEP